MTYVPPNSILVVTLHHAVYINKPKEVSIWYTKHFWKRSNNP